HVVSLGLSVDEHVEADLLLEADDLLDVLLHRLLVSGPVDLTLLQLLSGLADLIGLRVGADRGRGEKFGDVDASALRLPALLEGARTLVVLLVEPVDPGSNLDVAGPA